MSDDRKIETAAAADRPTFTILSEGQEIAPEHQLLGISVQRSVNHLTTATLLVLDGSPAREDFPVSNTEAFLPGKKIEVRAGYHSREDLIFRGLIVKHGIRSHENRPSVLRIECRDEAVKLSVGRKNRYFYESTDSDIIEELITGAGLQADVASTQTTYPEMVQYLATDWDFLVSRAEANGLLVFTEDGSVRVAAPDLGQNPELRLLYGGNIIDFEMEMDARHQYEGVHAFAWDPANQEMLDIEGEPPAGSLPGNVSPEDLAAVVGLGSYDLRHAGQLKDTELQAQADAQLMKSRLAKVRGRVRIQGLGKVRPGQIVQLDGAGDRFNGPLFVAGVHHEINTSNWETQLELGLSPAWFSQEYDDINPCPAAGLLPAVNGLQIGLVTALENDPAGEDRVQVRIPMLNPQEEGVWSRVASLDAGENRGAFFRPEIGDEVVLGFLDDDPRNPVILGMLNSSAKPAPLTASDDNHEKGFVTRSDMKVLFDDEKKAVTVQTPKGNKIVLSEDEGGITLEDENGNKIVLDANGITIESSGDLNIKASGDATLEGVNVSHKAGANFKAEGSSGAELSTSATAVVKGSIVQIN